MASEFVRFAHAKLGDTKMEQHASQEGLHKVIFSSLHVLMFHDAGTDSWFAQGLELDHFSQGKTKEQATQHFSETLAEMIGLHLTRYKTLEHMLKPAPAQVWGDAAKAQEKAELQLEAIYQVVKTPDLQSMPTAYFPYKGIEFYVPTGEDKDPRPFALAGT